MPVAYASEALSLAALELYVHLSSPLLPADLVAVEVRVPDGLSLEEWPASRLPAGWDAQTPPVAMQALGADWVHAGRSLLLRVPSVIVPQEWNVLINPAHPEFGRLQVQPPVPFQFDPRMTKAP